MTLVHVKDRWLDVQSTQQAHSANSHHNLLPDARGHVAAVDPTGELTIMLLILGKFGIEQIDDG